MRIGTGSAQSITYAGWLRVCTPHTVQDLAAASPDRIHIWSTSPTVRLADGMHQQLQELPGLGWPR